MKLYLHGHDYKYAAEQMLLTLFPAQRPEYPAGPPAPGEDALVLSLHRGTVWATATAALSCGGREYRAARRCRTAELTDPLSTDRALQRILKLAFYGAGTAARGSEPPWGALTGVRPVKIPTKAMLAGASPAQAERLLRDTYRVTEGRRRLAMDCAGASLAALRSLAPGEVSLYVGIPFCPTRCAYCSFVSADVGRALKLIDPFLDALCRELAATGAMLADAGLRVRTVYFGGGTPTTLSAPQLDRLMGELAEHIDLSGCTEYTVEAGRPDTITAEKLAVLARRGCSRVSVNPQTMQDAVLERMGRAHRADDILRAYALARESGIGCINMDLIAGLPGDSAAGFRASLEQVLALGPENVTVHTLALKKGSRLMEEGGGLPSGAAVADMLDFAWAALRAAGQRPYYLYRQKYMSGSFENVGWCRPGAESLYNICMMEELHTIVSLGGGGVTKLIDRATGHIERLANAKYPQEYIQKIDAICADKARVAQFYAAHGR
ncbi:Oxygen-independent coproporphyrinogen-III oxidase 2 [Flavonifractor plautii]|uniref:coproporphyrinogen dehydrogenase HemZ n=1 Tax=Flavonifractor plautii TaxID=292800 RepID=UPI0006C46EF9|nr:coproporphyrinogen dehydrogenase HemZ [Flavonifractor plautii]CUQ01907.1 Oxygen-independent coproporphyrinogen-III oxidase 2 [Flavonifractor plautii]CUQ31751.1 coproporphyrinogen dehydrogenase HemZ [Flavonifractor plautii]HJF01453.1 coproporphyrinogen dehydrogenase HemZ [Flavonifractor plautii]